MYHLKDNFNAVRRNNAILIAVVHVSAYRENISTYVHIWGVSAIGRLIMYILLA